AGRVVLLLLLLLLLARVLLLALVPVHLLDPPVLVARTRIPSRASRPFTSAPRRVNAAPHARRRDERCPRATALPRRRVGARLAPAHRLHGDDGVREDLDRAANRAQRHRRAER